MVVEFHMHMSRVVASEVHPVHTEADMQLLENSVSIAGLKAADFDAIYIPGGYADVLHG